MNNICIYHKSCADGFGAALSVKVYLDKLQQECEFLPAFHGDEAPDVTGKNVYIVDFAYPRDVLIRMSEQAESIIVLDHHKTAEADLVGLPFCEFDMSKSGAMMAWEKFGNADEVPDLIRYIQDRDLWTWALPMSKAYSAALQLKSMDFEIWEPLLDNAKTAELCAEGEVIEAYQQAKVKRALKQDIEMVTIAGHQVPCINTTHLISEIGNELAKGHPFAAMFFDTADKRVYSLRSAEDGIDVALIAKQFGGGGHFHAAGFSVAKPAHHFNPSND
ncbi:DHHA1 domain-containing protein [Algibacillus agarilyticus]|uniref:DHHA1 domain-containing protein n=1 Tax=Algibacillus agarilyticus TaxID=2234133 RepID=UPI000DCFEF38|nr:DHHA1 domain-containing protein [Algibacillus agarilyticus]